MTPRRVLLATRSPGKLRELRPIFAGAGIEVLDLLEADIAESPGENAVEERATFEENALAKARYFLQRSGGLAVVADDSGLEVHALDGRPGVRSKRWSGREDLLGQELDDANNALLVAELRGVADRSARYVCAAAYADETRELVVRGESAGLILDSPRGRGGFGYDPYFFSTELGRTFGEASREEKQRVSHRGRAFVDLVGRLCG